MAQKKTLHKCEHHSLLEPLQLSECPVVVRQGTLTQLFDSEFIVGTRKAKLQLKAPGDTMTSPSPGCLLYSLDFQISTNQNEIKLNYSSSVTLITLQGPDNFPPYFLVSFFLPLSFLSVFLSFFLSFFLSLLSSFFFAFFPSITWVFWYKQDKNSWVNKFCKLLFDWKLNCG